MLGAKAVYMLGETASDKDSAKTEVAIQYLVFLVNRKKSGVARAHGGGNIELVLCIL